MTSFVADTHALVWHLTDPRRLGRAARRAFEAADAGRWLCQVPTIVLIEVSLLQERGRLRCGVAQVLDRIADHPGYQVLSLDLRQAVEFVALATVRDPMDRIILASARALGARLVTADESLRGRGIPLVWD